MTKERAVVVRSGSLEFQVDLMRAKTAETTFGAISRLVRTNTALGVRAERIGAPVAVGRLVTHA